MLNDQERDFQDETGRAHETGTGRAHHSHSLFYSHRSSSHHTATHNSCSHHSATHTISQSLPAMEAALTARLTCIVSAPLMISYSNTSVFPSSSACPQRCAASNGIASSCTSLQLMRSMHTAPSCWPTSQTTHFPSECDVPLPLSPSLSHSHSRCCHHRRCCYSPILQALLYLPRQARQHTASSLSSR